MSIDSTTNLKNAHNIPLNLKLLAANHLTYTKLMQSPHVIRKCNSNAGLYLMLRVNADDRMAIYIWSNMGISRWRSEHDSLIRKFETLNDVPRSEVVKLWRRYSFLLLLRNWESIKKEGVFTVVTTEEQQKENRCYSSCVERKLLVSSSQFSGLDNEPCVLVFRNCLTIPNLVVAW